MWFWNLMILKDNWICQIVNFIFRAKSFLSLKRRRLLKLSENIIQENRKNELFIILNGPSIKNQDLNVLKGKTLLFVNRGFIHPEYKNLSPKYHMFIDPKMLTGEWTLNWIYDILELVPDITFILPVSWAFKSELKVFIEKKIKILWIDDSTPAKLLGVGGYAIEFGMKNEFKNIYFTGFEATGLAHEMINSKSHFYGVNSENSMKTTNDYISDLYMFSRHLYELKKLSELCKLKKIEVYNLTEGGLLDMFPKMKIEEII